MDEVHPSSSNFLKSIIDIKEANGGTFLELVPYICKYKYKYSLRCL
jgi:hypothetical protein